MTRSVAIALIFGSNVAMLLAAGAVLFAVAEGANGVAFWMQGRR